MSHKRITIPTLMGILLAVVCALPGCKVIKIGEESKYTGASSFDASTAGEQLWEEQVEKEYPNKAVDLAVLLNDSQGDLMSEDVISAHGGKDLTTTSSAANNSVVYCVKGTGTVTSVDAKAVDDSASSKGYITVQLDDYSGSAVVRIAVGPVVSSTSLRDYLDGVSLNDFKDTTEWSNVSKSLNELMLSEVIDKADIAHIGGKTVSFVGCFTTNPSDANAIDISVVTLSSE